MDYNFHNTDLAFALLDFLEGDDPRGFAVKAQERFSELVRTPAALRPVRPVSGEARRAARKAALRVARELSLGVLGEGSGVQDLYTGIVFVNIDLVAGRFSGEEFVIRMLEVRQGQYWGTIDYPYAPDAEEVPPSTAILFALITDPPGDTPDLSAFVPPYLDC